MCCGRARLVPRPSGRSRPAPTRHTAGGARRLQSNMPARVAILLNPASGTRGPSAADVRQHVQASRLPAQLVELGHGRDLTRTAGELAAAGCELIVAGGGDGTVNAVAAGVIG